MVHTRRDMLGGKVLALPLDNSSQAISHAMNDLRSSFWAQLRTNSGGLGTIQRNYWCGLQCPSWMNTLAVAFPAPHI